MTVVTVSLPSALYRHKARTFDTIARHLRRCRASRSPPFRPPLCSIRPTLESIKHAYSFLITVISRASRECPYTVASSSSGRRARRRNVRFYSESSMNEPSGKIVARTGSPCRFSCQYPSDLVIFAVSRHRSVLQVLDT